MSEVIKFAAAYIRVSDDRQDEYSPDSQLKLVREYAKKNGYFIPNDLVFYDDGISAKSSLKRTEFNRMIAMAKDKSKPFDAIFVWKFSRFARNQEESIVYKSLLKKNGVSVISISEPIIDGVFGSLIERIIEWMDEYYLINLSTEVKRGMLEKASRGEPMCAPATGYDLVGKNYVPNADAPIVRQVFEDFVSGMGLHAIAQKLTLQGVRTKRGNPPENRFVEYMINNPVYIGKIRWSTDGRTVSRRDYDSPNTLVIDGTHEPIISQELWDKAHEIMEERKRKYVKHRRESYSDLQPTVWMLKGLVKCSSCGSSLVCCQGKKPSIQCYKYAHGSCPTSHHINIDRLDRIFIEALKKCAANADFLPLPTPQKKSSKDVIDYNRLIAAEQRKLQRIRDAYECGADTLEEYKENKSRIDASIADLKRKAQESQKIRVIDPVVFTKAIEDILYFIEDDANSIESKNALLKTVIADVVFDKKNNSLVIHFF